MADFQRPFLVHLIKKSAFSAPIDFLFTVDYTVSIDLIVSATRAENFCVPLRNTHLKGHRDKDGSVLISAFKF